MGWIGEHAGVGPARVEEAPLAFDEMVTRYHGRIYGYLPGMVGDTEQAQDLTQDTFLTILTIERVGFNIIFCPLWGVRRVEMACRRLSGNRDSR